MTDTPRTPPASPYVTGEAVAGQLSANLPEGVGDRLAATATMVLWGVVDDPGWTTTEPTSVPAGIQTVTLYLAADIYRAGLAQGTGDWSADMFSTIPASVSSASLRRYSALYAPWAFPAGMVG